MTYTLSMFNTGQVTLPKKWRSKHKTHKYIAVENQEGNLVIKPLEIDMPEVLWDANVEVIEDEKGIDIAFKKGLSGEALDYFTKALRDG